MTRTARRLRQRLEDAGLTHLPEEVTIQRTYAGRHQRSMGAWSWELGDAEGRALGIGSSYPATRCAAEPVIVDHDRWTLDTHIWPERLG